MQVKQAPYKETLLIEKHLGQFIDVLLFTPGTVKATLLLVQVEVDKEQLTSGTNRLHLQMVTVFGENLMEFSTAPLWPENQALSEPLMSEVRSKLLITLKNQGAN